MLTVHHLGISQSDRIVWLCEELGIEYRMIRYERDPVDHLAPAAYRALHPAGTAPIITDGDVVLAETMAIVDYIVARHGGAQLTVPAADPAYADYLFWYHFSNGSLMPAAMMLRAKGLMATVMHGRMVRYLGMYEAHFAAGNEWLTGDRFTVADIVTEFPFKAMRMNKDVDLTAYPHIQAYVDRIVARPAYQRAMDVAEPGAVSPGTPE